MRGKFQWLVHQTQICEFGALSLALASDPRGIVVVLIRVLSTLCSPWFTELNVRESKRMFIV